ncbi:hypothetical protein KAT63_01810 [Candidatus Parcubacteria bacterium]|nr:hypothetical protein [Candidatus Parcubacteria bacterium]
MTIIAILAIVVMVWIDSNNDAIKYKEEFSDLPLTIRVEKTDNRTMLYSIIEVSGKFSENQNIHAKISEISTRKTYGEILNKNSVHMEVMFSKNDNGDLENVINIPGDEIIYVTVKLWVNGEYFDLAKIYGIEKTVEVQT